jgi:hypothetical protein
VDLDTKVEENYKNEEYNLLRRSAETQQFGGMYHHHLHGKRVRQALKQIT